MQSALIVIKKSICHMIETLFQ